MKSTNDDAFKSLNFYLAIVFGITDVLWFRLGVLPSPSPFVTARGL
jgi:hypothetical protein